MHVVVATVVFVSSGEKRVEQKLVEQSQRQFKVRGSTSENGPRIRAGVEKKEQQAKLIKQRRRAVATM